MPKIASIAKAINCELIGEGVETEVQRKIIKTLGIAYAQVNLFSRNFALRDLMIIGESKPLCWQRRLDGFASM